MWMYFTDPILKAPTLGCMAMCIACSLMGAIIFVRKEVLLGETLSHAAYPGVMLAALLTLIPKCPLSLTLCILLGAAFFSFLAMKLMDYTQKKWKMHPDSSMSFVLTAFFGLGLTAASYLQFSQSRLYKQALVFLMGQAATITDSHMYLSLALMLIICAALACFYLEIQMTLFDPVFSKTSGVSTIWVNRLIYFLMIATVVVGIRSIGLFLLSGMFIAPVIAARQWTYRLKYVFLFSGCIGLLGGFLGVYFSVEGARILLPSYSNVSLATGPMILLTTAFFTLFSLFFAPKQGWVFRGFKILKFRFKCMQENVLKSLWHMTQKERSTSLKSLVQSQSTYTGLLLLTCFYLHLKKEIQFSKGLLTLTQKGHLKAQNIVRLHRLWELYLVHIGVHEKNVHHHAEQMEHIITPSIEQKLAQMMKHPTVDPHNQPIPTAQRSPYL